jgi:hypothetical protein
MEAKYSSETPVYNKPIRRHIPEDDTLLSTIVFSSPKSISSHSVQLRSVFRHKFTANSERSIDSVVKVEE